MSNPGKDKYFEDYVVGIKREVGTVSMNEAEIIDFASKYDPQDFHINPKKAAAGPFGGLIASGWQTAAVVMRVLVDHYLDNASSLGSPGVDELRWMAPVRTGDRLTVHAVIIDARRSKSKPDRGLVVTRAEIFNQDGIQVMSMKAVNVIACRNTP